MSFSVYHPPPPPPPFLFDSPAPPSVCAASSPFYASRDLLPLGHFSSFSLFSTRIPTLTILIICTVLASLFSTKRLILKVLPSGKLTLFSRCIYYWEIYYSSRQCSTVSKGLVSKPDALKSRLKRKNFTSSLLQLGLS